jgi:hypothetical protein
MNIIAQLQGGLGNQLFQYATARALAYRENASLQLDTAWFEMRHHDVSVRDFELTEFQIDAELLSQFPLRKRPKRIRKIFQTLFPISPYIYQESKPYQFDKKLIQLPSSLYQTQNLYLLGYWQSYKYFSDIRDLLMRELQPRAELSVNYHNFLRAVEDQTSVMVHIRRGDYVYLQSAAKVHGFLGIEYYNKGMQILVERNPEVRFFVFSDDIEWAKNHLPLQDKITYIQTPADELSTTQELFLMSRCKHHLIANSSLSWWGAWLAHGNDAQHKVLAPRFWTNDHNINWQDLIPDSWERI